MGNGGSFEIGMVREASLQWCHWTSDFMDMRDKVTKKKLFTLVEVGKAGSLN